MQEGFLSEDSLPSARVRRSTRARPRLVLSVFLLAAAASVAFCIAAILVPAPPFAAPLAALTCVGAPMFAGWQVPDAVGYLRTERAGTKVLVKFRRGLEELPEIEHPLGL
jgi:hypothetical protein